MENYMDIPPNQAPKEYPRDWIAKSVPKHLRDRIEHWDDERECGNSLILTLKPGWMFPDTECHTQGVDTVKEAIVALRDSVECHCPECVKAAQL